MIEVTFEKTPWESALEALHTGDTISAVQCLSLLEDMSEESVESALLDLEERGITLNISDLPRNTGNGEAALRLRKEQQLAEKGQLFDGLEENDPLRLYLDQLSAMPTFADVNLLARRYADGDTAVAQQLVNATLSCVVERACAMTGSGVLLLDLIQEGNLGLWQGILNYSHGDFMEHVRWWIDQYLSKTVLLQVRSNGIGQKLQQGMSDYWDMDQRLLGELGRSPTMEEIAEAIHVSKEEAAAYEAVLSQARVKQQVEQAREPKEETPDDSQAVEDTAYFQIRQRILDMLSTLTEQEAKLLTLRFGLEGGLPQTPQQVGEALGLTAEETIKLETTALLKLRQEAE